MYKRSFDFRKIITPANSTEVFAMLAVIGGLCIALFLPELPIRLIGVCVSVLGGVGFFMLISQRLSETVDFVRKPVSQPTPFRTTVKHDSSAGKRIVFDDFATAFGGEDDAPKDKPSDAPDEPTKKPAKRFVEHEPSSPDAIAVTPRKRAVFDDTADFDDELPPMPAPDDNGISEVRIIEKIVASNLESQPETTTTIESGEPTIIETISQTEPNLTDKTSSQTISNQPLGFAPVSEVKTTFHEVVEAEQESRETAGHKRARLNIQIEDLMEEDQAAIHHNEPRKEFDHLLTRVLMVIRSVTTARTAAFFWVNHDKRQLVLESFISDNPDIVSQQRKFLLSDDVVSQIATSGRPEILTEIKPAAELDLIPYYVRAAGTVSFIGVPVFFGNTVVGVLCADTKQPDAYDAITVGFFGHFTKLISGLVQSYTGKYDLLQGIRALDTISNFRTLVNQSQTGVEDICASLIEAASGAVEYYTIGVGMFDHDANQWSVHQILSKDQANTAIIGSPLDLDNSLIGNTILTAKTTLLNPVEAEIFRVAEQETPLLNGYFISVPLKSMSHNYGALFVEGPSGGISAQDISILEILGEQTGTIIEQLRFQDMLQTSAMIDETRGIFNSAAFLRRLQEEISRSADYTSPITLLLVHLDHYFSIETSHEVMEYMIMHIISIIRKNTKQYDIVGELDSTTLAITLIGQKTQKAQMWAERLRKEIASSIIEVFGKRFTVTVSIGVAEAMPKESSEILIKNTQHVLQIALQKSNSVSIFG
jgi:diguanylate cyclase (GGDEF)-like protein